jgi:hypothetical protein
MREGKKIIFFANFNVNVFFGSNHKNLSVIHQSKHESRIASELKKNQVKFIPII